ncbi:MAG: hypothetical protein JOY67_11930 [Hyphomicrobiales bacterium]|nr:hypothetical protein [Hyphomicrobiales bacterium]
MYPLATVAPLGVARIQGDVIRSFPISYSSPVAGVAATILLGSCAEDAGFAAEKLPKQKIAKVAATRKLKGTPNLLQCDLFMTSSSNLTARRSVADEWNSG